MDDKEKAIKIITNSLKFDAAEKNYFYHDIKSLVSADPKTAASDVIQYFEHFLNEKAQSMIASLDENAISPTERKKGSFRRIG